MRITASRLMSAIYISTNQKLSNEHVGLETCSFWSLYQMKWVRKSCMAIEALKKYVSPVLHIHTKEIETMETCDDWSSGASDAHIRHQFILEGHTGHTHDRNTITVNLIGRQPKPTVSQRFRNYTTSKSTSYKISLHSCECSCRISCNRSVRVYRTHNIHRITAYLVQQTLLRRTSSSQNCFWWGGGCNAPVENPFFVFVFFNS